MTTFISTDKMKWQDHPVEAGVETKFLAQLPDLKLRFRINRVGEEGLAEHSHPNGHIFSILRGSGKMWVEDAGSLELSPGAFIVIPPDLRHRLFDVIEPLEFLSIGALSPK
jgi:mannose-6-phosphate isomerase-like protein (cupin superfamily)